MQYVKPNKQRLQATISESAYSITQEEGTETPFHNDYWDNKAKGIYVDILSGEPLFSSLDKYDSGTGWPSFTQPIDAGNIVFKTDSSLFGERTEVRSRYGDNHLGHIFDDGPTDAASAGHAKPTGKRYCMNSGALHFIPEAAMDSHGYGKYVSLLQ